MSLRAISDNLEIKLPKTKSMSNSLPCENGETEKNAPTSSKTHRKLKSISQPADNQRLSMKSAYDIVELRTPAKKDMLTGDEEQMGNKVEEKFNSVQPEQELKNLFKSMLLRKYSAVLFCQW